MTDSKLPKSILATDVATNDKPYEISGAQYNALVSLGLEDSDIITEEVKKNDNQSLLG